MFKPSDPRQLCLDLLPRSICAVQVAAVLADNHGIFGWGWNGCGAGLGEHAEAAALRRSNRDRLEYSTIYVASLRKGRPILSKPCQNCHRRLLKWGIRRIIYRDNTGIWQKVDIL